MIAVVRLAGSIRSDDSDAPIHHDQGVGKTIPIPIRNLCNRLTWNAMWTERGTDLEEIHKGLHGGSFVRSNFIWPDNESLPVHKPVINEPADQARMRQRISPTFFYQLIRIARGGVVQWSFIYVNSIDLFPVDHPNHLISVQTGGHQQFLRGPRCIVSAPPRAKSNPCHDHGIVLLSPAP